MKEICSRIVGNYLAYTFQEERIKKTDFYSNVTIRYVRVFAIANPSVI